MLLRKIGAALACFFIVYLIGTFVAADFDIRNWHIIARFITAGAAAVAAFVGFIECR